MGILFSSLAFAKTKALNFTPQSGGYTNVVQDIAVYQEECQNHSSGHYTSELYEFDFSHNDKGDCIIIFRGDPLSFKVVLDDEAKHVIKNIRALDGSSVTYNLFMKKEGWNIYYSGTAIAHE